MTVTFIEKPLMTAAEIDAAVVALSELRDAYKEYARITTKLPATCPDTLDLFFGASGNPSDEEMSRHIRNAVEANWDYLCKAAVAAVVERVRAAEKAVVEGLKT